MTSQNKSEYIKKVLKEIYFAFDRKNIKIELIDHMEDLELDFLSLEGDVEKRERLVCEEMGDPTEIGKELNKLHNPWIGYMWYFSRIILIALVIYTIIDFASFNNFFYILTKPVRDENIDISLLVGSDVYEDFDVYKEFTLGNYTVIVDRIVFAGEGDQYIHILLQDIRPTTFLKRYFVNHQFNANSVIALSNGVMIKPVFNLPGYFANFDHIIFNVGNDEIDSFSFHYKESIQEINFTFEGGAIK